MIERRVKSWRMLSREKGPDVPLFEIEFHKMQNPRNQVELDAIVLKLPDTINVVALDAQGALILVEQYRFGIDQTLFELPAGFIDHDEDPLEAAKRELLEETGYGSGQWKSLGVTYLNPSYVNNRCFHFLAKGVKYIGGGTPDSTEDIAIHKVPANEILTFLKEENGIQDAIGLAAISKVFDLSIV